MPELSFPGCRLTPLLSYLKALGLFRVVSEQHDPTVRGRWREGQFAIESETIEVEALVEFLVQRYRPAPIVSPWNSRGGFRRDRMESSERLLAELEATSVPRLSEFRSTVTAVRQVWDDAENLGFLEDEKVVDKCKAAFIELCRGRFPDSALDWLDAAVVLTDDGISFPAMLGTGGNLGSGDLSSNYLDLVLSLTGARSGRNAPKPADVAAWLGASLWRCGNPKLGNALVGQLDPGGAGGLNMPGGVKIVNPWDLVLGLEGAALFASGVARRLGTRVAAVPFTVKLTPATVKTFADGEDVSAELWLPEWDRALRLPELRRMLAEGRAQWGRRQAQSGLDFAQAATSLGVDRSITAFSRYLIAKRHGKNNLAVHVGRFTVGQRREVDLLQQLDRWLGQVRSVKNPSRAVVSAGHRTERAVFDVSWRGGPRPLQQLLIELARLEMHISRSRSAREETTEPVPSLSSAQWTEALDDQSAEFAVAAALASQRDALPRGELDLAVSRGARFGLFVRPVELDPRLRRLRWSDRVVVPGLADRPLYSTMPQLLAERAVLVARRPSVDRDATDETVTRGLDVAFRFARPAPLSAVLGLLAGHLDESRVAQLAAGMSLLDWSGPHQRSAHVREEGPFDPLWALLAPFFHRNALPPPGEAAEFRQKVRFRPDLSLVGALARGDGVSAARSAQRRLHQFGFDTLVRPEHLGSSDATRVSLALATPISTGDVLSMRHQVAPSEAPVFVPSENGTS